LYQKKSLATSIPTPKSNTFSGSLHIHGITRKPVGQGNIIHVFSDSCMIADALTKVVTVLKEASYPIVEAYQSVAIVRKIKRNETT
jgi:thiamine biosynthesis lipoprotein ApbE